MAYPRKRDQVWRWAALAGVIFAIVMLAHFGMLTAKTEAAPGPAAAPPPRAQRIVSLNLCTDQLVMAVADRDQIAGLTRNANDPAMSADAVRAKALRLLGGSAEELLTLDPDLVVGMGLAHHPATALLDNRRYRMLDLRGAATLGDVFTEIRQTAVAVGNASRGEAVIARMNRELAGIPKIGGGKVAAYYQRRGYLTGTGTLIDDLMARVGLRNLAAELGKPPLSQVSLEEIVAARPDYLIVESATDRVTDQGSEMLHHPALRNIPRISIPQAWTVCGGPAYVHAARGMAGQIAAHSMQARRPPRERPLAR